LHFPSRLSSWGAPKNRAPLLPIETFVPLTINLSTLDLLIPFTSHSLQSFATVRFREEKACSSPPFCPPPSDQKLVSFPLPPPFVSLYPSLNTFFQRLALLRRMSVTFKFFSQHPAPQKLSLTSFDYRYLPHLSLSSTSLTLNGYIVFYQQLPTSSFSPPSTLPPFRLKSLPAPFHPPYQ